MAPYKSRAPVPAAVVEPPPNIHEPIPAAVVEPPPRGRAPVPELDENDLAWLLRAAANSDTGRMADIVHEHKLSETPYWALLYFREVYRVRASMGSVFLNLLAPSRADFLGALGAFGVFEHDDHVFQLIMRLRRRAAVPAQAPYETHSQLTGSALYVLFETFEYTCAELGSPSGMRGLEALFLSGEAGYAQSIALEELEDKPGGAALLCRNDFQLMQALVQGSTAFRSGDVGNLHEALRMTPLAEHPSALAAMLRAFTPTPCPRVRKFHQFCRERHLTPAVTENVSEAVLVMMFEADHPYNWGEVYPITPEAAVRSLPLLEAWWEEDVPPPRALLKAFLDGLVQRH